jgi:hypothetical protein
MKISFLIFPALGRLSDKDNFIIIQLPTWPPLFLATDPQVPGSIPGAARFSEK